MSYSEDALTPPAGAEPRRIMVVYGTRPEAVKVAPLIRTLATSPMFTALVTVTAQHRSMLDQVNEVFGIKPDFDLDIHQPGQTLSGITTRALAGVQMLLARERPDAVVVQGDTTTVFAAGLAAFYEQIPVVHLEAGLRTADPRAPYPEEINRRLATQLADLHLAPTATSRANLLAENVDPASVVVTGNTVIDALQWAVERPFSHSRPELAELETSGAPVLLVTAHRRESLGRPLREVGHALARIARSHCDLRIVFPIHRNPLVRDAVLPAVGHIANVTVTEPLPYGEFAHLMNRAALILTDSGGVQEEGPSLGKPVLVMRDTTDGRRLSALEPSAWSAPTRTLSSKRWASCLPTPLPTRLWPMRSIPTGMGTPRSGRSPRSRISDSVHRPRSSAPGSQARPRRGSRVAKEWPRGGQSAGETTRPGRPAGSPGWTRSHYGAAARPASSLGGVNGEIWSSSGCRDGPRTRWPPAGAGSHRLWPVRTEIWCRTGR